MGMGNKLMIVGIVVLAVIAVVLGYQIYQETLASKPQSVSQTQTPILPQTVGDTNISQVSPQPQDIDVESILKQFPSSTATDEERIKSNDYLLSLGQEVDTLTIVSSATANCSPTPKILRVKKGTEFKIVNQDNVDHKLSMFQKDISVKANTTITVKTDWGAGAYGYVCDGTGRRVGILHIIDIQ